LALYGARPDKGYSHTDCRSMAALRALGQPEIGDVRHPGAIEQEVGRLQTARALV